MVYDLELTATYQNIPAQSTHIIATGPKTNQFVIKGSSFPLGDQIELHYNESYQLPEDAVQASVFTLSGVTYGSGYLCHYETYQKLGLSDKAGLPEITGEAPMGGAAYGFENLTGAFANSEISSTKQKTVSATSSTYSDLTKILLFTASASNSIYGSSETVTPLSLGTQFIIKT